MFDLMRILTGIISVYMILIFIRILLTWFSGADFGKPYVFLCRLCDPYLNWFRRFRIRNSPIDFSPLIALAFLSLVHRILLTWGATGRISAAVILVLILSALWTIIAWVLGFFIVILILRMIAFLGNSNIYSPFWRFVDFIAQPVMYRISRFFFPARIITYFFRIIFSITVLVILGVLIWGIVQFGLWLLMQMPF